MLPVQGSILYAKLVFKKYEENFSTLIFTYYRSKYFYTITQLEIILSIILKIIIITLNKFIIYINYN